MLKRYVLILGLLMISLFCFAQDSVLNNVNKIIDKASLLIHQQNVDSAETLMIENQYIFMDSEYNSFLYNYMMGKIYMGMLNFDVAQMYYGEASKIVDKDVNYYIAKKDSCALGIYYYYGSTFAFSDFDKALQLYNKTKKYYELASLENTWLYQFLSSYLELYETDSDESISIKSELDSALYHIMLAEFDEAISILTPLLKINNIDAESMGYVYYLLGDSYWKSNNYRMAENIFNEGLNDVIYKMRNGPLIERMYYTELGDFYNSLGNYTMALDCLAGAKELYERNNDFKIGYVKCLYSIASTMINQHSPFYHISSKMLIDIAIDYALKLPNTIETDIFLSRLYMLSSVLYDNLGLNELSIDYLKRSMKIDVDIPDIKANQYSMIAIYNMRRGVYDTAQYYAYKAYQISKLNSLSIQKDYRLIYLLSQYLNNDIDYVTNVSKLMVELQEDVIQNFLFLSSTQRREYWCKMLSYIYGLNTFLYNANDVQLYGEIYNQLLFAKGMLLRTSNFINGNVYNEEDRTKITQLRQYQDTLSSENMINEYMFALIQNQVNRQEKDLLQENIGYIDLKRNFLYDWHKIQKSLKRDEKAVEFIQLWGLNKDSLLFDTVKYAAIVVDSKSKYPQIIPLCTNDTLRSIFDRDITTISTSGKKSQLNRYVTNIYSTKNPRFMNGEELYSLVWEPLEDAIGDAKTIIILHQDC